MASSDDIRYFEHYREVTLEDVDDLEHVNNAVYLSYIEDAARAHAEREGLTLEAFRRHGVIPVVRRHEISYHRPAELGDVLLVSTRVVELGGAKAVRNNEVRLAETGMLLVEAVTQWVWLDPESRRPKRVPEAVRLAFG